MPPSFARITTLSFDGDATLWDFEHAMRRALEEALDQIRAAVPGAKSDALALERMVAIREAVAAAMPDARLEEIRLQAFRRTLAEVGCADEALAREIHRRYMANRFAFIELYPDTLPALKQLKSRYRIALLSNGNTCPEKIGLEELFDFALFAQDIGAAKPDPAAFRALLERTGCAPSQILHTGDSPASDVAGAQGCGIPAVWLNREGAENRTDVHPDCEIASLAELPFLLGRD